MFSKLIPQNKNNKSLVGTVLDTDLNKKGFTTYIPKDVLENEIYNHNIPTVEIPHDIDIVFAQNFIEKEGKFIYCTSKQDLRDKINKFFSNNQFPAAFIWEEETLSFIKSEDISTSFKIERTLDQSQVAISRCESLVADEGSIIINPNQNRFRPLDNFPAYHIILASRSQVKLNIEHAVSDFIHHHSDIFPFIIDLSKEEKNTRFAMNKPVLISRGTKQVIVFYCEECDYSG